MAYAVLEAIYTVHLRKITLTQPPLSSIQPFKMNPLFLFSAAVI